ncbi:hypothetical protein ACI4B7_28310, partial [Klebsiella pneumoniae]|uniref:hypothetical protein n=1 Tax=Klebsiella pneumoniae TaxID=573 RepID=UPI0038547400
PEEINDYFTSIQSAVISEKQKTAKIILRPNVSLTTLMQHVPSLHESLSRYSTDSVEQAEIQVKYERYIEKEKDIVQKMLQL